jgi:hypothetical protein
MATRAPGPVPDRLALAPMDKTDPTMQTQLGTDLDSMRQLYAPPSYGAADASATTYASGMIDASKAATLPQWYPRALTHMPVQYGGPSPEKENMDRLNQLIVSAPESKGAMRYAPIGDKEVNYLKYMEDMAELAKFDNYVESFVDPRQPGSAEFLFKVYPEYINRRMQQAHTDYEFALRNQMIDMWGINTFDDLYFKYLVDQKRIDGPTLTRAGKAKDDEYVGAFLAPWKHPRPPVDSGKLYLPFSSAKIGQKPGDPEDWTLNRAGKPFSKDYTRAQMAHTIFTDAANTNKSIAAGGKV